MGQRKAVFLILLDFLFGLVHTEWLNPVCKGVLAFMTLVVIAVLISCVRNRIDVSENTSNSGCAESTGRDVGTDSGGSKGTRSECQALDAACDAGVSVSASGWV